MKRLFTIDEVAKILMVNRNKVYELIKTGHLSALKLGRKKVPDFEIDNFLRRNLGKDLSDLNNITDLEIKSIQEAAI